MENILCFGDSNTYGYVPADGSRYDIEDRWTGILQRKLGSDYRVIEEGLVGRTTVFEDSVRPGRKGSDFLVPLIDSHAPVNRLVIMLGTNDCKSRYKASPQVIGMGLERLIKDAKQFAPDMDITIISPIALGDFVWMDEFDPEFDKESIKTAKGLSIVYKELADEYDCDFLAASDYAQPSEIDQEHMTKSGHSDLADAIYHSIVG